MAEIVTQTQRSIRRAARRGLVVFLPLVVVLSGAVETWLILNPQHAGIGIAVLMFCPTIAAVVTRLVRREGFADVSFRLGGRRALPWYALAVLLPLAVGSLAYGVAAATGLIGMTGGGGAVIASLGALLLGPGWVSHLLQQIAAQLLGSAATTKLLARVERTYAERRAALVEALERRSIAAHGASGLGVWVPVTEEAATVQFLSERGWAVSPGERFRFHTPPGIRITTTDLEPAEAAELAAALAETRATPSTTYSA